LQTGAAPETHPAAAGTLFQVKPAPAAASDCVRTACTKGSVILIASFILQAAGKSNVPLNLLIFPLMIAVFYFLLIRPNQTKQKKWATMLAELKPGDRVTTTGGIRGTILTIKDDAIQLRVAPDNLKLEFVKSAIASVTTGEDTK
jgi:preprotein translocase subunit YajC